MEPTRRLSNRMTTDRHKQAINRLQRERQTDRQKGKSGAGLEFLPLEGDTRCSPRYDL